MPTVLSAEYPLLDIEFHKTGLSPRKSKALFDSGTTASIIDLGIAYSHSLQCVGYDTFSVLHNTIKCELHTFERIVIQGVDLPNPTDIKCVELFYLENQGPNKPPKRIKLPFGAVLGMDILYQIPARSYYLDLRNLKRIAIAF